MYSINDDDEIADEVVLLVCQQLSLLRTAGVLLHGTVRLLLVSEYIQTDTKRDFVTRTAVPEVFNPSNQDVTIVFEYDCGTSVMTLR